MHKFNMNLSARFLLVAFVFLFFTKHFLFSYNLSGNVYDPEKSRLSNVHVAAFLGDVEFSSYTVDIGYYQLDVPQGTFFIKAEKPGYLPSISKIRVNSDMKFDIYMFSRTGYYLYGRIVGNQLPEYVELYVGGKRTAKDTLSENGLFMFSGLPKGTYELKALVDGQLVSEKVALDEDSYVTLRIRKIDAELKSLDEILTSNKTVQYEPVIIFPDSCEVDDQVKGYVLFSDPSLKVVRVSETGFAYPLVNGTFQIKFSSPGDYTITYKEVSKKVTVSEPAKKQESTSSETHAASIGWTMSDYVLLLVMVFFGIVGIALASYSLLFARKPQSTTNVKQHIGQKLVSSSPNKGKKSKMAKSSEISNGKEIEKVIKDLGSQKK